VTPVTWAFWLFAIMTIVFVALTVWLIFRRATSGTQALLEGQIGVLRALERPEGDIGDVLKAIADAVAAILKALGDFGTAIDKLGPLAISAIFTILFSVLTLLSAWLATPHAT
jgi:hypothetical protein